MGREVRRVPVGYVHPKDKVTGRLIPKFIGYEEDLQRWAFGAMKWLEGLDVTWKGEERPIPIRESTGQKYESYEEWNGDRPEPENYMLVGVPHAERTMLMMFETCTEGTPISPAFKTAEELARWLADNEASAFGASTASYEAWLNLCQEEGSAFSAMIVPGVGIMSGVEAIHASKKGDI